MSLYGQIHFKSQLVNQLIQLPIVQRLGKIAQNGFYGLYVVASEHQGHYPTRLDHSIGACYLCQLIGASEEIQIFALLHDLYHTHFSHDTDFLSWEQETESLHEKNKTTFLHETEGIDDLWNLIGSDWLAKLSDPTMIPNYQIVKSKTLGADNLDYILRDGWSHQIIPLEWINQLMSHVRIQQSQMVIDDPKMMQQLIDYSIRVDREIYNSCLNKGFNIIAGRILRLSLEKGILSPFDLYYSYLPDTTLLEKIQQKLHDPEINVLLNFLQFPAFYYCDQPTNDEIIIKKNIKIRGRALGGQMLPNRVLSLCWTSDK